MSRMTLESMRLLSSKHHLNSRSCRHAVASLSVVELARPNFLSELEQGMIESVRRSSSLGIVSTRPGTPSVQCSTL